MRFKLPILLPLLLLEPALVTGAMQDATAPMVNIVRAVLPAL